MTDSFYIQWHITNYCNLRCSHCYQDDFSKASDLDWAGLRKIGDNLLSTLGAWGKRACIHLTGGEPLLKPELLLILNYLDRQPLVEELGLITNGLFITPEVIRELSAHSKLRKIKISLEGGEPHIHESIRPRGTFGKVMEQLSLLQKEGRFEILFMFTAMKRNYKDLSSLLRLCEERGVDGLIIERFIPWGKGKEMEEEALSKGDWLALTRTLLHYVSMDEEDRFLPYQAFQVRFDGEEPALLGAPCVVGVDGLCIMPQGDVFPCRRFPLSIGNLLVQSLKELWERSEILEKIRKKEHLRGRCGTCDIDDCRGCRSLAFSLTGDYLAEDPHCWYFPQIP